jgi:hypothetical protein
MLVETITPAKCHTAFHQLARGTKPTGLSKLSVALFLLDYQLPVADAPSPKRRKARQLRKQRDDAAPKFLSRSVQHVGRN